MSNFGALIDYFGVATTDLVLVGSNETPVAKSVERAQDEDGDHVDEDSHGQTAAGTLAAASCTYALKSGTLNLNTIKLGYYIAGASPLVARIMQSIAVPTSNAAWPQVTITGLINVMAPVLPGGAEVGDKLLTYTLPSITIAGRKQAQLLDFSIGASAGRLIGSAFNASIDVASQANGLGVIVAHGISGGVMGVTCEQVYVDGVPTWTHPSGYILTQAPGHDEPQAGYHVYSMAAETILERDVVTI